MRTPSLFVIAAMAAMAAVAANPMPAEFSHQFRNGVADHPVLRLSGPNSRQVAKADGQGLRITLPGKRQGSTGAITVSPAFGLRGDCEVMLGFDLLSTEDPLSPRTGAGVVLMVEVAGPETPAVCVSRLRWPGKNGRGPTDTFGASLVTREGGTDKYDTKRIPATANSGRLRLERTSGVMKVSIADGAGAEFRLVREIPVGTADLHSLSAECRAASGGVDARFVDLTVRAESLINESEVTSPPARFRWVPWVVGAVVLVAGGYWFLRHRVRVEEPLPIDSPGGGPASVQSVPDADNGEAHTTNGDGARRE